MLATGDSVVDHPRPRVSTDTLSVTQGGVAVVGKPGVRLTSVALGPCPATFEVTAARATIGSKSYVVVVIYRPRSDDVTQTFFDDLSALFDRVVTTNDALSTCRNGRLTYMHNVYMKYSGVTIPRRM